MRRLTAERFPQLSRARWTLAFAIFACQVLATSLQAQLALDSSSPAAGSTVEGPPSEIRLTLTAVAEVPFSSLQLNDSSGAPIELGALSRDQNSRDIFAAVEDSIGPGRYTVRWKAVRLGNKPIQGEYVFDVGEPEIVAVTATLLPSPAVESPAAAGAFGPQSPIYAAIRWLMYVGLLGTIGAATFGMLMGSLTGSRSGLHPTFSSSAERAAAGFGIIASLVILLSSGLRLFAQAQAELEQGIDVAGFSLLMGSAWGTAWMLQVGGSLFALTGFTMARGRTGVGTLVAALGGALIGISVALSGHAAAVEGFGLVPILSDTVHVLAAGAWLGTLLMLLIVVVPRLRRIPRGERAATMTSLLPVFSSIVLTCGGLIVASGLFAASLHLNDVSDLWNTPYGRLLSAKLVVVLSVFTVSAANRIRFQVRPLGQGADLALRRRATIELATAGLVVALTSFLVAVPPPTEQASAEVASGIPIR